MNKYYLLSEFLSKNAGKEEIRLTINEIESIVGSNLPKASTNHVAWWSNSKSHPQSKAWLDKGWVIEKPSDAIKIGEVKFINSRVSKDDNFIENKDVLPYETYVKQFEFLSKSVLDNQINFEKTILTLSSSFLAVSVTFLGIFRNHKPEFINYLYMSWSSFGFSIILVLLNYLLSIKTANMEIDYVGDMMEGKVIEHKGVLTSIVSLIYIIAAIAFVIGLVFFLIYCGTQI